MRHAVVTSAACFAAMSRALATSEPMSSTLPSIAEYAGGHEVGPSFGLIAIAAGFVAAGAWLLYLSARDRG